MCFAFILSSFLIIFFTWFTLRNELVFRFRTRINNACYDWSIAHLTEDSAYDWYMRHFPTYDKLFWSFKPLKVKYWMPEDLNYRLFGEDEV